MTKLSQEFTCKCEKQTGWITEGEKTKSCPECGRVYIGKYSKKALGLIAEELTK